MSTETGSITGWLCGLQQGDSQAIQPLLERYFASLVKRAEVKLRALHRPLTDTDGEDIVLSAFVAFHDGVLQGRFPRLEDRYDLWRVLLHLTACKAIDSHRAFRRTSRGGGRTHNFADLVDEAQSGTRDVFEQMVGPEPSPEYAALVAEEYRLRLEELGNPGLRRIAELKLACHTNEEIRSILGCSLRTVTNKLDLIRRKWGAPPAE